MSQVVSFADYTPAARFDGVAWSAVKVEESDSSSGPWTLIDTLTLSPTDSDPSDPQSRNLTTDNGSDDAGLWYRLTFVDGGGGTGQPTDPIQNGVSMVQFATADEFAERFGLTLTADESSRVSGLIGRASALIQDAAKQQIVLVTDDVLTLNGTRKERVTLPERPVVSVASVTLDGETLTEGTDWFLADDQIVRRRTAFVDGFGSAFLDAPFLLGSGFGFPSQTLVVTYTHGFATIPGSVKEICLEAVVRVWVNPGSVARQSSGNTSTVYDNSRFAPTGLLLTSDEKRDIRRFFGSPARSISVGG